MKIKQISRILIVVLILFSFSCAPRKGGGWFKPPGPDERVFQEAEARYNRSLYDEAFALYQEHLDRFPESRYTPAVLLKMGMIRSAAGDYPEAEGFFERVIRDYPKSVHARNAGVEMLSALYLEGKYSQVMEYAPRVPIAGLSRKQALRVHMTLGDSNLALRFPLDAYHAYLEAFKNASKKEYGLVILRLKTVIALMPPEQIDQELEGLKGKPPAGYLMYQKGLNAFQAGNIGETVTVLTDFIDKFPRHENVDHAKQMLAALKSADLYAPDLIGCLLPLSGRYEAFGRQALEGIELALETFAKQHPEHPVRLLVRDTASDPRTAQQAVVDLSDRHVAAVIGPLATASDAALKAQSLGLPIVTLTQKPGITDIGEYVFRNFLTPRMQVEALMGYAAQDLHLKRFAILYPKERYGETFMNLFWDEVIKSGGRVMGVEAYNPEQTDFADSIKKLVGLYYEIPEDLVEKPEETGSVFNPSSLSGESGNQPPAGLGGGDWFDETIEPAQGAETTVDQEADQAKEEKPEPVVDFDAVFIPDSPDKVGLILPQLAYYDIRDVCLLGTNLWHSEKLIQMAKSHARGAILAEGFFDQGKGEQVLRFVRGFKKIYGRSPGFIEAVGFDTAMILFNLVTRPDVAYRTVLIHKLTAMEPYDGVTGRTCFAQNGEAIKDIYLLRISKGKFKELDYLQPPVTENSQ